MNIASAADLKRIKAGTQTGLGGLSTLDEATILKNLSDPPDAKRKKDMDQLAQQAAAGDQSALLRLQALSGYDAKKEGLASDPYADLRAQFKDAYGTTNPGAATADSQNYARLLVSQLTGQAATGYLRPNDAYIGDDIGKVLKVAAPVAGALIPGVGMLGAAAIGGLGNAAGQYAATGKIDPKQALASGGLAAAGNAALGNGLGSVGGSAGASAGGGLAGAAGAVGQAAGGGGSGGLFGTGLNTKDVLTLGLGGLGAIDAANQSAQADKLRGQALQFAANDYNARAPIREAAVGRALAPLPAQRDLSQTLVNRANPYSGGR